MKYTLLILGFLITCELHAQPAGQSLSNVKRSTAGADSKEDILMEQNLLRAAQLLSGIDAVKEEKVAFDIYLDCAKKGSVKAMNALGIMYNEGLGVAANRGTAIQWFQKAGLNGYAKGYYNLGMLYKDGKNSTDRDFDKAFASFSKAADLNDPQSVYATAYFYYKGFGTEQNYRKAFRLFKGGAYEGRSNSMYFLALCYRNGYGTEMNTDSARYWLSRAYNKGYRIAGEELASAKPENSNTAAKDLARKIRQATPSIPESLNQYKALEHTVPSMDFVGNYKGFIIRYDWSGEHAIGGSKLVLELKNVGGKLTGKWVEADTMSVPFQASLTPHSLNFTNAKYVRKDHYYDRDGKTFNFETAKLQWVRRCDSLFLSGSVQMFSDDLNEPQKPQFISLVKSATNKSLLAIETISNKDQQIAYTEDDGSALFSKNDVRAFPNPFVNYINVDFKLKSPAVVEAQLISIDGRLVYKNNGGRFNAGEYTIALKPPTLTSGDYLLKVFIGGQAKIIKVIKL